MILEHSHTNHTCQK
jgi:hypothetical protein